MAFTETYGDSKVEGQGFYQYSASAKTYTTAIFFNVGESSVMTGILDHTTATIEFALANSQSPMRCELVFGHDDQFSYRLLKRDTNTRWIEVWVATFLRGE